MKTMNLHEMHQVGFNNDREVAVAESLTLAEQDLEEKLRKLGIDPTRIPTELPEEEFDIDNIQPSETEQTVREGVKGAAQGYLFDVTENILTATEDLRPELMDFKVIFNIPGLKNYDPKKDFVSVMSDDEFMKLKDEKKISYMPQIVNEGTPMYEFTRTMGKVVRGLQIGGTVTKPFTSLAPQAMGVQKSLDFIAPGAVASQIAFNPYEERATNMINEIIQDTPIEVASPFFEWLQADDNNKIAEERFKMALESIVLDAAFGSVFKLFKARRDLLKGTLGRKSSEELAEIEAKGVERINDLKHTKSELPASQRAPKPSAQVLNAKPSNKDVFSSEQAVDDVINTLVTGNLKEIEPVGYRVFNTKFLEDEEASNVVGLMSNLLKKEMSQRYKDIPKGPKTLKELEEKGIQLQDTMQGQRIINTAQDTADQLGIDPDLLIENLSKRFDSIADLDTQILAYRGAIAQYGNELAHMAKIIQNTGDSVQSKILKGRFIKLWEKAEDAERLFGETKRIVARATTVQRVPFKANPKTMKEMSALDDVIKDYNLDTANMTILSKALETGRGPLHKMRILNMGKESLLKKGGRAMIEFYRGLLLASLKTQVTNAVSGTIETFLVPTTRYIGGIWNRDQDVREEVGRHMHGLLWSTGESARLMLRSFFKEQNILDPMGTKIDGLVSNHSNAIAMSKINPNLSNWHPVNYISQAVNYVGKSARFSMRLLGGADEFFKQVNYRAQAFAKITKDMPQNIKGGTKQQRDVFIQKEMDNYFDELGRATDKDMLEYSRRVTFTEELRAGSYANKLHKAAVANPPLQLFFPFVRTPANIFGRALQRTPIFNRFSATHREMLESSNPALRAQAHGDTALGVTLYGAVLGSVFSGRITGPGPLDPDRNKIWRQAGNQPYSIRVGDNTWISYNRFDPAAMPFVFVSAFIENAHTFAEKDEGILDGSLSSFAQGSAMGVAGMVRAIGDRTYLYGLKTFLDTINEGFSGNFDRLGNPIAKMGASLVPGIIEQVSGDDVFQEAVTWQEQILRRATSITGYSAPKYNWITGQVVANPFGYNTGIPIEQGPTDKYISEIVRMGKSIKPPDTKIGNVELTGPQYSELNKLIGTIELGGVRLREALAMFMESETYGFSENRKYNPDYDDFRIKGVQKIMRTYKQQAKKQLMASDSGLMNQVIEDRMNAMSVMGGGQQLFDLNQR